MADPNKVIRNPGMKVHGSDYYTMQGAVPTIFHNFLNKRYTNGKLNANYSFNLKNNTLYDPTTGITWNANGTMTNKKGQTGTWNTKNYSYSWLNSQVAQQLKKNSQSTNLESLVTLSGTKPQVTLQGTSNAGKKPTTLRIVLTKPTGVRNVQPRINNSAEGQRIMAWLKRLGVKADGWWGKNTTAAYDAWKAKLNHNKSGLTLQQATLNINPKPILATPGYGIHVGNSGVTLSTPNGLTTDITNSHNVSALIDNGNYKAPTIGNIPTNLLEQTASNLVSPNLHLFSRGETRDFMRLQGLNPYDYSASERKAFRHSISNDTGDWSGASRIMSDARINNKLGLATGLNNYQLEKPQLNTPNLLNNNLVSLKFKQGGQMFKYQQGGQAQLANGQQGMEQQAIALVQAAMLGDLLANQTIQLIMLAAQQGDQQALQVAQLLQAIIQKMQGSRKARLGAKLNYFKLASECPEGQEVVYFKKGGEICKVCQGKKMLKGGKSDPVSDFKKKREQELLKKNYQRNPATRGKSAKEIAEMQRKNREEASLGKGESPAPVAPWTYKKK